MDNQIKTSFIPKKSLNATRGSRSSGGFVVFVSVVILILAGLAWGGSYLYLSYLGGDLAGLQNEVNLAKRAFDSRILKEFEDTDKRINTAHNLLNNHISPSLFLRELDALTLKTVSYDNLKFYKDDEDGLNVDLSGEALDFASVALQAKAFSEDGRFVNPIFDNLDTNDEGRVVFDASLVLSPELVSYVLADVSQVDTDINSGQDTFIPDPADLTPEANETQ